MEHPHRPDTSILLVDDETLIRKSFSRELLAEGFAVTAVSNGREAIDAVQRRKYDVVVTDLHMPGIDGFGVLEAVKRMAPRTCVIILTGYGDVRQEALRLGADEFILKPCEVEELVFRIRHCVEHKPAAADDCTAWRPGNKRPGKGAGNARHRDITKKSLK